MRAEELGPDSYWCEQCKAKKNATKKFYIARPPKVRFNIASKQILIVRLGTRARH